MANIHELRRQYQTMFEEHGRATGLASVRSLGYTDSESYLHRVNAFQAWDMNKPFRVEHATQRYTSCLDVGCGFGDWSDEVVDLTYTGIDLVPEFIDVAKARHDARSCRFIEGDFLSHITATYGLGTYDLVVAMGTTFMMAPTDVYRLITKMWDHTNLCLVFDLPAKHWTVNGILATVQRTGVRDWIIRHVSGPDIYVVYMYRTHNDPDATKE